MFETMAQFVLAIISPAGPSIRRSATAGNPQLNNRLAAPTPTRDGHVCALIYTDKHWKAFFDGAGRLDLYEANPHLDRLRVAPAAFDDVYRHHHRTSWHARPPPRRWLCSSAATFPARR